MNANIVFLISVLICVLAYVINPRFATNLVRKLFGFIPRTATDTDNGNIKIFTKEELAKYKGEDGGSVYLAVIGNVYDVSRGRKHYGPGGGYEFFAGIDGTKAFVTGQFDKEGLVDDISELSPAEILSLDNWKSFYEKDYKFVGRVEGSFYDKKGNELPMVDVYRKKMKVALLEKDLHEHDKKLFPPCNSEWSQARGGRVWCSTRSGGVERDWAGVPRMYYTAGTQNPRCACVRTTGPPSNDPDSTNHKNRGDLDNPNLNLYPNCGELSDSCPLPRQS